MRYSKKYCIFANIDKREYKFVKDIIMATLAIKYNPKNLVITKFLDALIHMSGVEVLEEEMLTPSEMRRVRASRKSKRYTDIEHLKEILDSKL